MGRLDLLAQHVARRIRGDHRQVAGLDDRGRRAPHLVQRPSPHPGRLALRPGPVGNDEQLLAYGRVQCGVHGTDEGVRPHLCAPKIVFSSTLDSVEGNARLVRGTSATSWRRCAGVRWRPGSRWRDVGIGLHSAQAWWMSTGWWCTPSCSGRASRFPEAGSPAEASPDRVQAIRVRRHLPRLRCRLTRLSLPGWLPGAAKR